MALTVTKKLPNGQPDAIGGFSWLQVADVLFDSSYATGGEALTRADLGFLPDTSIVFFKAESASGFEFQYDRANSKLKVLAPGVAFGAAGAATLDDFPLSGTGATATSISLANSATSPVRFGGQLELASAVDLSAVTTRIVAIAALI